MVLLLLKIKIMETKTFIEINPKFHVEEDEFGVEYDVINQRLISAYKLNYNNTIHYKVRSGTRLICDGAFMNLDSLELVQLPDSIKLIEERAFIDCENLKSINFPEGLESIENSAFARCYNLNNIILPSTLKRLEQYSFYGCSKIENFKIDKKNQNYLLDSGIVYSKDKTSIIFAFSNLIKQNICLPEGLKEIKEGAFCYCNSLISIEMPESMELIGDSAFENCISLQTINLPKKLKLIGNSCFNHSTITSILIPENVESIGIMAFSACYALTAINVAKSNKHFIAIKGVLFSKDKTKLLNYPSGSKQLEYIVPKTVKKISSGAFQSCLYLEKVELPLGLSKINEKTFSYCINFVKTNIPSGVEEIGRQAFEGCLFDEIQLPDSVVSIKHKAFEACGNLKTINIPHELTQIESHAFSLCDKLKVEVHPLNPRYKSFDGLIFEKCNYIFGISEFYNEMDTPF
jgi:hypothetical protein